MLSTKMNNDRAGGRCYGFAWILRSWTSVTPTFLFKNRFYLQLSPHCPKINKKSLWGVKKISRFLLTGHGVLPSMLEKFRANVLKSIQSGLVFGYCLLLYCASNACTGVCEAVSDFKLD